ncbi:MAG: hypothetical protein NW237_04205 [Cyanobacteriota bacterium]|nr:hypothetical protein [Cyanobacteriota bacterium]
MFNRLGSRKLWGFFLVGNLALALASPSPTSAGPLPPPVWGDPSCAVAPAERVAKRELLQESLGDPARLPAYQAKLAAHRLTLARCRAQTWPTTQATWLRLYAYDAQPGVLADVLDRIVNRGYNRVFVEVFYDGRVLLPVNANPTPWRSVLQEAVAEGQVDANRDLWAETVRLAHERGLEVYGWMFALNFGYGYSDDPRRAPVFARNGAGESSIAQARFDPALLKDGRAFYEDAYETEHLFVDPYHPKAQADLLAAVKAMLLPQPNGILFDYIRYPTPLAADTLVTQPQDLWIYGEASQQALQQRFASPQQQALLQRFLATGRLTPEDIAQTDLSFADSLPWFATDPFWSERQRAEKYQAYFWQQVVEHAYSGVLQFLQTVSESALQQGISVGGVFFPGGNRAESGGFDARMQPWDRFPSNIERHPMSYAICQDGGADCVAAQVGDVLQQSLPATLVCPVLAGTWGQSFGGHASLEVQMQAIQSAHPQLTCISHFVYAWMEPDSDRDRKAGIGLGDWVDED